MANISKVNIPSGEYIVKDKFARKSPLSCTTASSTAAKTVDFEDFELVDGACVYVRFSNGSYYTSSSTQITLNVNETGAKNVILGWSRSYTTTSYDNVYYNMYAWYANDIVEFTYNSSIDRWVMRNTSRISDYTSSYTPSTNYPYPVTERSLYYTLPSINGSKVSGSTSIYAPTSYGSYGGMELQSVYSGAPVWKQPSYNICSTSATTAQKEVTITGFRLYTNSNSQTVTPAGNGGQRIRVKFTYTHNSNSNATLRVYNGTAYVTAYPIVGEKWIDGSAKYYYINNYNKNNKSISFWNAGEEVEFELKYVTLSTGYYNGTSSISSSSSLWAWVPINSNFGTFTAASGLTLSDDTSYEAIS